MFYFRNKGTLPLIAITTLGVSDKDESSIGRFGTGLKYTIAGALRLGQEISIMTGGHTYYFFAKPEFARSKEFSVVWMKTDMIESSSQRLGFTTELGKHWEPWMYIRELYSNCRDEDGEHGWIVSGQDIPRFEPGEETLIICAGPIFDEVYQRKSDWLLSSDPVKEFPLVDFHPKVGLGQPSIFYKGILIGKFDEQFDFDINLKGSFDHLTEDRTLSNMWVARSLAISAISNSEDDDLIEDLFMSPEGSLMHYMSNEAYLGTRAKEILKEFWDSKPFSLNPAWRSRARALFKADDTKMTFDLTPVQREKFTKAKTFLKKLGFTDEVEWNFVDPQDNKTFGFVRQDKIYICRAAFDQGTQFLAQVMLEEYLHAVKSLPDYAPEMQSFLFSKIISLGEELAGAL